MKRILIFSAIILLLSSSAFSQGFHFGIKGGADLHKLTGSTFSEKFSFGYHLGGFVELGLSKKIALQPELYYSEVNYDTANNFRGIYPNLSSIQNVRFSYINIPILLDIKLNKAFMLQVGPQFGILVNSSQDLISNGKDAFKKGDFSMVGGVQLNLMSFCIYGRYVAGLNDVSNIDVSNITNSSSWKSQTIHLGVGLRF